MRFRRLAFTTSIRFTTMVAIAGKVVSLLTAASIVLGASIGLTGCTDPLPLSQDGGPALQTDRGSYAVEVTETEIRAEIPWQYVNPTSETVYVVNCNGIAPPTLERKVDGAWKLAYAPIVPQCLSEPITIEPGATYRDTLRIHAGLPDANLHPQWTVPIEGTYRLQWSPRTSYDENAQGFGELLPLDLCVSNEFRLEEAG